ncbi:MAG TPA: hypothetical protein VKV73_32525 [Chloroflexota bacterium]|nr:hypothetical protein [Chloroflexota bacterium]
MRYVPRTVLAVAFAMVCVPLTAFADGAPPSQAYTSLPAALVKVDAAHDAILGSSTPVDIANATEQYNAMMGAAMAQAYTNLWAAQGLVSQHPTDAHAQAEAASALAAYNQVLQFCGFAPVAANALGMPTATMSSQLVPSDTAALPASTEVIDIDRGSDVS